MFYPMLINKELTIEDFKRESDTACCTNTCGFFDQAVEIKTN